MITITAGSLPAWLSLVDNGDGTAVLQGTPGTSDIGLQSISLTANDNADPNPGNAGQFFTLEVIESKLAPKFTSVPVETALEDEYYQYNITAEDPDDGDVMSFSSETLPPWLTLTDVGSGAAMLSGTPLNGDVGTVTITLYVTDLAGMRDQQTFTIEVLNVNDAPDIVSDPPLSVTAGELYTYNVIVMDPDKDEALTITVSALPGWLTFVDNGDGTATISGTPDISDVGDHDINITATDLAGDTGGQFFRIEVMEANYPPEFTSTPVLNVDAGSEYVYDFVTVDPNADDQLTFSIITSPAFLTMLDNGDGTGTIQGIPELSDLGIHIVEIRVEDSGGAFDTQQFEIEVIDPNQAMNEPPEIVGFTIEVIEDQSLAFTATHFDAHFSDPNNDEIVNIHIVKLPDHGTLSVAGAIISSPITIPRANINSLIYSPELDFNGDDRFDWNADDGELKAEVNAAANLNVAPVNDVPENLQLSNSTVNEGLPVGQTIGVFSVEDKDETDTHVFDFSANNGPDKDAFTIEDDRLITNIVLDYNNQDTYSIVVVATDNHGDKVEETFTIEVLPVEEVFFQNGITPNGDGINDTWEIKGLDKCPDCLVEIFNRWGQKIFSSVGYSDAWDGTFEGEVLPTGTYYYVIDYKNDKIASKGAVTILK
jgi:gliding motility-associated-like protein